ncbi:MAG: ABC transporter permease, partial [Clostridia bacterium]|nr:ABC transporter permease [Clostridia bacterium]
VYEYIYSTQTATSGRSDIVISTNSSSDRIINVATPLTALDGVENIIPSLSLYALLDGEYVQLRGFEKEHFEDLQNIDVLEGSVSELDKNTDNIVISKATAKHYGLEIGGRISLSLGKQTATFYVGAIADESGYFLNNAPFLIIGRIEGMSRLLADIQVRQICNEIYIQVADGVDVDALIDKISAMEQYSKMLVRRTGDSGYIKEQADSLSAPVVLAGAAVLALGVAVIVLLFMMSENEKVSLISKYGIVGATKKQILGIFLSESALLACAGAVLGSALAVGVFTAILKLTLSPNIVFSISVLRLFGAALLGLVSAIISSVLPIARAFKGTIRQNQLGVKPRSKAMRILCPVMIALTIVSVAIEFAVPAATAVMAVISLVLILATLGVCLAPAMRSGARISEKIPNPSTKVAAINVRRDGRFARSVTMLGVGMTVSVMLFMSWAMTKSVFGDYVSSFSDMIFVTNVQSTVDAEQFKNTDGVDYATKIVWQQGTLKSRNYDKTMNIIGS